MNVFANRLYGQDGSLLTNCRCVIKTVSLTPRQPERKFTCGTNRPDEGRYEWALRGDRKPTYQDVSVFRCDFAAIVESEKGNLHSPENVQMRFVQPRDSRKSNYGEAPWRISSRSSNEHVHGFDVSAQQHHYADAGRVLRARQHKDRFKR